MIALALLPAVLAIGLVVARLPIVAAGVLVGSALLAPGRALGDLQLVVDALAVARPELLVPVSLAPLSAGMGSWMLLAGHAATAVAGLLVAGRAGAEPGSAMAMEFEESSVPAGAGGMARCPPALEAWALRLPALEALALCPPVLRTTVPYSPLTR